MKSIQSLPSVFQKLFSGNALYIFLSRLFNTLAAFGAIWILSHSLSPDTYGQYQNFWTHITFFAAFSCMGLGLTLFSYPAESWKSNWAKLSHTRIFPALFLYWCILCVGFGLFQHHYGQSVALSATLLAVVSLNIILDALLIIFKRKTVNFLVSIPSALLFLYIHMHAAKDFQLNRLLKEILLLYTVKTFILMGILLHAYRKTQPGRPTLSPANYKLWGQLYLYDISQQIFSWIDKFLVSVFLSAEISAIYYNGTVSIPFLPLIFSAITNAAQIKISKLKDNGAITRYMNGVGNQLSVFSFPTFFFFFCSATPIFRIVFSDTYLPSVSIFRISLLVIPLRAFSYTVALQCKNAGRIINTGAIIDMAVAALCMYPFYKLWGLPGLALSFVLSTYIQSAYYLWHIRKLLHCTIKQLLPFRNWCFKWIISALSICSTYLIGYFCHFTPIISLLSTFAITSLTVLFFIKKDLNSADQQK